VKKALKKISHAEASPATSEEETPVPAKKAATTAKKLTQVKTNAPKTVKLQKIENKPAEEKPKAQEQ
jgi:hypothetical protein